jgi:hypothetical protein
MHLLESAVGTDPKVMAHFGERPAIAFFAMTPKDWARVEVMGTDFQPLIEESRAAKPSHESRRPGSVAGLTSMTTTLTLTFYPKQIYDPLECLPVNKTNGSSCFRALWIF